MTYQQKIEPNELEPVLESLSKEMELRDIGRIEMVVIGGAAMNLAGHHLRATIDVDVLGIVSNDSQSKQEPQLVARFPDGFEECVRKVSEEFNLMEKWLNFGPSSLTGALPSGFLDRARQIDFGETLTIHVASRLDLIHLKLHAVINTSESNRGTVHREDLEQLDPDRDELIEAIRWSHEIYQQIDDAWNWDNSYLRDGYRNIFKKMINESLDDQFFDETDE